MDEAAALMNDAGKLTWNYVTLLPYLQRAYRTLELNLFLNGVRNLKEVSAFIPVALGSTFIDLPADFVQPIAMGERAAGNPNDFVGVTESDWDQSLNVDAICYWTFREDTLRLILRESIEK